MIKADPKRIFHLNYSPLRGSHAFEKPLLISAKTRSSNLNNYLNFHQDSKENSFPHFNQFEMFAAKRIPVIDSSEIYTSSRRSGSVPRSSGPKGRVDQRVKVLSDDVQTPNFNLNNGTTNPNNRRNLELPQRASISKPSNGQSDFRSKSYGPAEEEIDRRATPSNESSFYLNTQIKGKDIQVSEEFPKIERSPIRAPKRIIDSSQLSDQYSNLEKLPSVEDKKKRLSALEHYVNNAYGTEKRNTGSSLGQQERRAESQECGGSLRKKIYAIRGSGNMSVMSDALNSTANVKSFDRDASVTENSELSEKEMNPEEIHYFFVLNIQKSRRLLSQAEK